MKTYPTRTWFLFMNAGEARVFAFQPGTRKLQALWTVDFTGQTGVSRLPSAVAEFLRDALQRNAFGDLVVIAPADVVVLLRHTLPPEVQRRVADIIEEDLARASSNDLEPYLAPSREMPFLRPRKGNAPPRRWVKPT